MEFILTCKSDTQSGYLVMTICGSNLDLALCDYTGDQEDIVSIVRVF
jgi:hypothetical protein